MGCIMIQGTSSSAGKSIIVTALCRILADEGYKVAPFKAQNMSSRLYAIDDGKGGVIALAQALQAFAARVKPSVYMNPILLKPLGNYMSSVIVLGKEYKIMHAKEYYKRFALNKGLSIAINAFKELSSNNDAVVIEGAGSPAEINISKYDIANMRLAERINAPVLIVSDIERGGCFASMLGTLNLLRRHERELVKGFIINKFRGDMNILDTAISKFKHIAKKDVIGVIPYIDDLKIPEEDSLGSNSNEPFNIDISMLNDMLNKLCDIIKRSIDMDIIKELIVASNTK
jgi:Cobyric acid synthase